jgi:hypothetical protein
MAEDRKKRPIPIYSTNGDCLAFFIKPHLYNLSGEWIGWVANENQVYDVDGYYVGRLTDEWRILRKRSQVMGEKCDIPDPPDPIRVPANIPLPPMMPELPFHLIDVLDEQPYRLHTRDTGELRDDMD